MRTFATIAALGLIIAVQSAAAASPHSFLLRESQDSFDVAGTPVACIFFKQAPLPRGQTGLLCYVETGQLTYRAKPGTYEVLFADTGMTVSKIGSSKTAFLEREPVRPVGAPPGLKLARPLARVANSARLIAASNRGYVAGTNIECELYTGGGGSKGVFCALVGRGNRVPTGDYAFGITDQYVVVSRAKAGGKATLVWTGVQP